MRFAVYLPPAAERGPVPALYWLSGLTCTEENFSVKAGAQRYAAELGLALIIPDSYQLLDQGRIAEADSALAEAAATQYAAQGPAHFETARYRAFWARTRSLLMDYTAADSLLRSALPAAVESNGEGHYREAEVLYAYGEHTAHRGDTAAAEAYFRQAAEIQRTALGADHPERARTLHALGALLSPANPAAAEAAFREALAVREARLGTQHPLTAQTRTTLQALTKHDTPH
jgi:hypothetical protein